jgi:hypothetical protein
MIVGDNSVEIVTTRKQKLTKLLYTSYTYPE